MNTAGITIRLMKPEDFDAVVDIDEKVFRNRRPEYYERKFEKLFESRDYIPGSLVAERKDAGVVGFVMGEIYLGEYGIFQEHATLDTIGVDPDYQHQGVGKRLIDEFIDHLGDVGVKKVHTLVGLDDAQLLRFFNANQFSPSKTINLERTL